jgi:preprotein translocase subunit Sec61beta
VDALGKHTIDTGAGMVRYFEGEAPPKDTQPQ